MIKNFLVRNHHVRWGIVALILLAILLTFLSAAWVVAKVTYYTFLTENSLSYKSPNLALEPDLDKAISSYLLEKPADRLPLSAGAYIVSDLNSKEAIVKRNENQVLPIASVTKLVTAIVAKQFINPEKNIEITSEAWSTYGNTGQLKVGENLPFKIALYPLLLTSSNDTAEAIAQSVGREVFMSKMNSFVKKIGMTNTHFDDPSGLSPLNVSTPSDLVKLAQYIHDKESDLLEITNLKSYRYKNHEWGNYNRISLMKYYIGGKNGYTEEANRTLVSLFSVPINSSPTSTSLNTKKVEKKNRVLAVVLLQSNDNRKDTKSLLNFLDRYAFYSGGKNGFVPALPKL